MQIYTELQKVTAEKTYVALGFFDGVHAGHQSVINEAVNAAGDKASAAVFTFAQNKMGSIKGKSIFPKDEKFRRLAALGVEHCLCPEFTQFAHFDKYQFVQEVLVNCLKAKQVFCGENFTFGKNKSGNINDLKLICKQHDIDVKIKKLYLHEGEAISSTRIKGLLTNGDINLVNKMLCAPYALQQEVISGKKIGRTMGYPTINQVFAQNLFIPKHGVYLTRVNVNGKIYAGATSISNNPTVSGGDITCETHIVNFNGDLYGEIIRVEFLEYYKPSVKFESLSELKSYIGEAAKASLNLQNKY